MSLQRLPKYSFNWSSASRSKVIRAAFLRCDTRSTPFHYSFETITPTFTGCTKKTPMRENCCLFNGIHSNLKTITECASSRKPLVNDSAKVGLYLSGLRSSYDISFSFYQPLKFTTTTILFSGNTKYNCF